MHPVLILQNQLNDGPAYLEAWLQKNNISYEICHWEDGYPTSVRPYSAIAVLGGSMSSLDEHPNIYKSKILILQALHLGIPVAGHCLGGQLLASALGAKIYKSPAPEIGWQPIDWIDCRETQQWFGKIRPRHVMHWHYEAFDIPDGGVQLASSNSCKNQAFSYGPHIGMQFHIEVDAAKVALWASETEGAWAEALGKHKTVQDMYGILSGITTHLQQHQKTADHIYKRWLSSTSLVEKLATN